MEEEKKHRNKEVESTSRSLYLRPFSRQEVVYAVCITLCVIITGIVLTTCTVDMALKYKFPVNDDGHESVLPGEGIDKVDPEFVSAELLQICLQDLSLASLINDFCDKTLYRCIMMETKFRDYFECAEQIFRDNHWLGDVNCRDY